MNEEKLAALLRQYALAHSVPGAAIGILRGGVFTTAYYGVESVATGASVRPDTRFAVGSLAKPMVATVIVHLSEAGRLSLDDPVVAHVPELSESSWAQLATLRDLLANRSGLPLRHELEFDFAGRSDDDDGALSRLVADAAPGRPSGFWSYTNAGWCVLGRVIETATGARWEDAMRRQLAGAGMSDTAFAPEVAAKRRTSGHEVTADGLLPVEPLVARAYAPAGTTVVATLTDLLRFAGLHLRDATLAELRAVHADLSIHGWLDSWCLGWALFDWEGGPVWGWDGVVRGERSVLRLVPQHQAAVVLLTNSNTGRALYRSVFPAVMRALFGIGVPPLRLDPMPAAAGDLSRFAGVYAWPDRRIEVTATQSGLLIKSEQGQTEAVPLDEATFVTDAKDPDTPTVTFGAFDASRRPRVLYEMLWGLPRLDD